MGEVLCAGVSHFTGFAYTDDHMCDPLRKYLANERTPAEWKNPEHWPAGLIREFGPNGEHAIAAAAAHRERVIGAFRKVRAAIDAFQPDFILIWGDDQYENFQEDLVPPFCIYLCPEFDTRPFQRKQWWAIGEPQNVWQEPVDTTFHVRGHPAAARHLARRLLESGFAVPYAYKPLHYPGLAHSFMNTILFLDYDRCGFDHRVIPFHVNCYGSSLVRNRGGGALTDNDATEPDPPAPSPRLCFDLGAAIARFLLESPWRAVLMGSSSWSHGFLTAKHHFLYPDVEADRQRLEELRRGDCHRWRDLNLADLEAAGQHEFPNWICLAGAITELECKVEVLDFSESYAFNSCKCTILARPRA